MRWIINYLRSCFCKHDWEKEEIIIDNYKDEWGGSKTNWPKVSATCKKCGYHKSYWKF